jgi:hypothetical protein
MDTKVMAKILGPRFDAVSEDGGRALKELRLPPDAAILDVGTGNGNFANDRRGRAVAGGPAFHR